MSVGQMRANVDILKRDETVQGYADASKICSLEDPLLHALL